MEPIFRSLGNGLLLATHVLANKKRETQSMPKYKKISRKTTKTTWTGCAEREPSQQAWHGLCMHLLQPLMPVMCSTHMHSFLILSPASDEVAACIINPSSQMKSHVMACFRNCSTCFLRDGGIMHMHNSCARPP